MNPEYIDVILPLALANTYTYRLPEEFSAVVRVGMRVIVPFGNKKIYTAIVYDLHSQKPENFDPKEILTVLDKEPVVRKNQLKFWEWIAQYYQCTLGEVFKAAVPSGLKLESETIISAVPDFEAGSPLKPKEQQLLDILSSNGSMTVSELNREIDLKNVLPLAKRLMELGAIAINEEVKERYKPKTETYVRLTEYYNDSEKLETVFNELNRAKKQLDLLMFYLHQSRFFVKNDRQEISKRELLEKSGASLPIFNALIEKGIFEAYQKEVGRLDLSRKTATHPIHPLTEEQQRAYREIMEQFKQKQTVLLHGVTSSGKTELYIHLIEEVLKIGKQVLFLLPEIALTTQLTTRLKRAFGNKLGIYHSRFSDAERVEIWNNLLNNNGYQVILGVRSSVFLPFRELGLIIVDEEHENTYKQFDPAPRYHARNAAIVLASMCGAKVLLGSATPSIESYYNAQKGKFGLVELFTRFEGIQMPEILIADTKEAKRKKEMRLHFTPLLVQQMKNAMERKEQVILFQNRRGFAPYVECKSCACVPKCKNCDVSLTYHKATNQLTCHYCGYTIPVPEKCPACGNPALEAKGFGTEKIEEEVLELFPGVRVARLDLDTARSRKNYEKIITDFENGKIDVLVGTQMISKGLDFERVRVVGILNADSLLNYPDFRSYERAFQLMAQVSGRAGRKNNRGIVVLQTSDPLHQLILQVKQNNFREMYDIQLQERQLFSYPPFHRLIYIHVKGRDFNMVDKAAVYLAQGLRSVFGDRVYGPDKPIITRIQNLHIKKIMLKIEQEASFEKAKQLLNDVTAHTLANAAFKPVFIQVDVDPM
ncbi:MAG: primosomal protein N' [Prevotellaceae bacterium]|jgi:primosomal protein N' (replication factor Y)|nr:primosomal protein N' [Prevotellaceae bacterium]